MGNSDVSQSACDQPSGFVPDNSDTDDAGSSLTVNDVDEKLFLADGTYLTITIVDCTLSNGASSSCYQIVTNGVPSDHEMGPWCPSNIADGAEAGGIWLEGGEVYDVDGAFIQNMATFYNDDKWLMYDSNGDIYTTETEEDCGNAANPNVGVEYENFCVECLPSYITDISQTYLIPITPVKLDNPVDFVMGPAGGNAPSVSQNDGHVPLIGYAMDGHGIYTLLDASGNEPTDLDDCRGHYDEIRGYHYHVDYAGTNNFINCLSGAYAN